MPGDGEGQRDVDDALCRRVQEARRDERHPDRLQEEEERGEATPMDAHGVEVGDHGEGVERAHEEQPPPPAGLKHAAEGPAAREHESRTADARAKRMTRRTLWGASAHVTSVALMPKSR